MVEERCAEIPVATVRSEPAGDGASSFIKEAAWVGIIDTFLIRRHFKAEGVKQNNVFCFVIGVPVDTTDTDTGGTDRSGMLLYKRTPPVD